MRLKISHTTTYAYERPVTYGLQQVRLTPKATAAQRVLAWEMIVTGGRQELSFEDAHRNRVHLISFAPGTRELTITCGGEVDLDDTNGLTGQHGGFMPLWMFMRATPLTRAGTGVRRLAAAVPEAPPLPRLHDLMHRIRAAISYETGVSHVGWTAEEALAAGHGVCQDMAHAFVAAARVLGVPARYVSGYLMMNDRVRQDATHAWAEAHVPDLGWVGFDPSNGISPDTRYVRVATGLDYAEAAPVAGLRTGEGAESMTVNVDVEQISQQ